MQVSLQDYMKNISILLALYILLLSLLPCGDGLILLDYQSKVENSSLEENHQHSNNCNDDPCSPICGCSCCSIAMDYPIDLGINLIMPPIPFSQLPCSLSEEVSILSTFDIWQPPKYS